jgi:hypothetical protein
MIVCVSSFCRREWDASSGPCACAREGEGSYDEEHRVLVFVVAVVVVAVVLRRVERDDKDICGTRLTLTL